MIVYELRCDGGHGFEAWFRNADAYDHQHETKQIACPVCGDMGVSKAPMAPRIARGERGMKEPPPEQVKMVMSKIAELNKHIAETCDYVGASFPEEARKIHYGETEHREIYGEATQSEAAELHEEGIAIAGIPWLRRSDS
jgi:hypothetical protein